MPEQLACSPKGTSFSSRSPQNNAVLQVKMSANASMAIFVNLLKVDNDFRHRVRLMPVERFENGTQASRMNLLIGEIFANIGSLGSVRIIVGDFLK